MRKLKEKIKSLITYYMDEMAIAEKLTIKKNVFFSLTIFVIALFMTIFVKVGISGVIVSLVSAAASVFLFFYGIIKSKRGYFITVNARCIDYDKLSLLRVKLDSFRFSFEITDGEYKGNTFSLEGREKREFHLDECYEMTFRRRETFGETFTERNFTEKEKIREREDQLN